MNRKSWPDRQHHHNQNNDNNSKNKTKNRNYPTLWPESKPGDKHHIFLPKTNQTREGFFKKTHEDNDGVMLAMMVMEMTVLLMMI